MSKISRRKILKLSAGAAALAAVSGSAVAKKALAGEEKEDAPPPEKPPEEKEPDKAEKEPDKKEEKPADEKEKKEEKVVVVVSKDKDPGKATLAALKSLGGMKKFVKKGNKVVVKPNIGWDRKPEEAATTNPQVVATVVSECVKAGAKQVLVFDRPCDNAKMSYDHSGIKAAAEKAGAKVIFASDDSKFKNIDIPKGKMLKSWTVFDEVQNADVFINVPIAKHHGSTRLTLGIKNLMGVMGGNRGQIHQGDINQKLADYYSAVKPHITIIDATRILIDKGPKGGGANFVREPKTIIASTDTVAADAYATTLFKEHKGWEDVTPEKIGHIKYAYEMGLGEMRLDKIKVVECGKL